MAIVILKKYIDLYKKSIFCNEKEMEEIHKRGNLDEDDEEYLADLRMLLFEETFIVSVFERALKTLKDKEEK